VSIRAMTADDKAYSIRDGVVLPPLTRNLRIDYTALSLSIPERVRFRYRLDGWDTGWQEAGTRRSVFYTDLRPGRYTLRVLACNNDDVWNEQGATFTFTVAPTWYQTAWWQGGVWIAAIGSVLLVYRHRLHRASTELSARFDDRLAERTRIARDLHDTLLQTVQGSKMLADEALTVKPDPERMRKDMQQLSEWLGIAVKEGRAALNSLRVSVRDATDLAVAFKAAANDPTKPPEMAVSVSVHGEPSNLHAIVRDEIYRIGYEAMRNAYVHSKATRLDVELFYSSDFTLRVIDNGVGLDPAIINSGKSGHFGLSGMRERATNIGGTLTIENGSRGARITLVVPRSEA
jgi:signal transduction histidine kinase